MSVGPAFDRSRITKLLYRNREDLRSIRVYFRAVIGPLRRNLYRCLEETGKARTADVLRGLPQDEFMETAPRYKYIMEPRCWARFFRIEDMKGQLRRIDDLIERAYIRGRALTNQELLEYSIDLEEESINFLDHLIEVLEEIATPRALRRADETGRARDRTDRKLDEFRGMAPAIRTQRSAISLYIIIELQEVGKAYVYPYGRRRRKYPEGTFQGDYEIDEEKRITAVEGARAEEHLRYLGLEDAKGDFLDELAEKFFGVGTGRGMLEVEGEAEYRWYTTADVTVGDSTLIPDQANVGSPPLKLALGRMVKAPVPPGGSPRRDYQMKLSEWVG